jgi:hypothetical protein
MLILFTPESVCKFWEPWDAYLAVGTNEVTNAHVFWNLSVDILQRSGWVNFDYVCPKMRYDAAVVLENIFILFLLA